MQSNPIPAGDAETANADSSKSYPGTRIGNGFDSVASQYRAMQEAQLLHEETINQLREEVRGQRERLAELAKMNPAQKNGQLEMVMLRLSELERKIGEGAPDPLLNEIVHRLASLENNGPIRGMKDPRVEEIQAQVEALRQRLAEAPSGDSRTDDVVIRIASLEGAFRRAAQSRDAEEVQARIEALSDELNSRQSKELAEVRAGFATLAQSTTEAAAKLTEHQAYATELERVAERLREVEQQLGEARSDPRWSQFGSQLAALDRKLAEQNDTEIQSRVLALEERASQDNTGGILDLIADRVSSIEGRLETRGSDGVERWQELESRLARVEDPSELQSVREQVAALAAELENSGPAQRLLELSGRVRGLETRLDASPPPEKSLQDLSDHLARLEASVANGPSFTDLARLDAQLSKLKSNVAEGSPAAPADLSSRLAELENRLADAESSSRLEDADARLIAIETKVSALGEPAEIGRRLTVLEMDSAPALDPRVDDVVHRLAALESKPFESLSDAGLHELKVSVADLHTELEAVSKERLPVLTELPARLSALESRLREALEKGASAPGPQDSSALRDQIQNLSDRVELLSARPASTPVQDPRVSELLARIEWVERNGSSASGPAHEDLEALKRRLTIIEEGAASGRAGGSMTPGMQAELGARLRSLEDALDNLQADGSGADGARVSAMLQKETDRLSQWARGTMQEIADLRERVDSTGGSRPALDVESVEALAIQISNGLNNAEARALRNQMYFVYLSLGVLWALLMYVLFTG